MLSHIFLVHNLTQYIYSVNGMFWSLGLEWQWYWVFPIVLLVCIRSRALALLACLALTVLWHLGTNDLWGMGALPPRLFVFCCGIVVA
jgi:peptidoglycan/LPS O-acetylase OafA/YrhL